MSSLIAALGASVIAATCAADPRAMLKANDQALLDAFATGDRSVWDRVLSVDAVYIDENGAVMPRAAFLAQVTPLPPGVSGHLDIIDYQVRRHGDTALVIHRDDERETFHGISLHAVYLTSETWLCRQGSWRLAQAHTYVAAKDPPAVPLPATELDDYVGRYSAGSDLAWVIEREGDHLVGHRLGAPPQPLSFELKDLAFIAGQPRDRRVFQRDAQGRVTGFILRREGEDIIWRRQA